MEKRRNHRFDIEGECEKCGVRRRKAAVIRNMTTQVFNQLFNTEYSVDGIFWGKEFINCKSKDQR